MRNSDINEANTCCMVFLGYGESFLDSSSFDFSYTTDYSDSTIQSGMNNTIVIPSSIFTNSYFYQHEIADGKGNKTWPTLTFYGDNASADNTTAHISGIITGNRIASSLSGIFGVIGIIPGCKYLSHKRRN